MTIDLAGAPVSFGVFELTDPGSLGSLPTADRVCEVLAEAGYAGVDLGPAGFLGEGSELELRLRRFGLGLAGGWIDLPFSDDELFENSLPGLNRVLELFTSGAAAPSPRAPKPTLADSGDTTRRDRPGGGFGASLSPERLEAFARNVTVAAERVRGAGFEPTFHHHMGTYIETPDEIDAFLAATDIDLTFDTGHLLLGGGDPLRDWKRWASRINHLHVKDVDLSVLQAVQARGGNMVDVWASGAFVPVGDGDLALAEFVQEIIADGYQGWLVIEQDVLPTPDTSTGKLESDQILNIERLTALMHR